MKKFFAATILALTLLIVESSAQAMPVQLYDHSVDYVISDLRAVCSEHGISLWGTEYYTYQGARRCELHFGNSDNNTIRFRLNNDNSVVRALVTVWRRKFSREYLQSCERAGILAALISLSIGLTQSEMESLFNEWENDLYDAANRNQDVATNYHKKFSIWGSRIHRYVVLDVEGSEASIDYYLYAYD